MSADDRANERTAEPTAELAEERRRNLVLAREIRLLEDRLAEARSEVLRREQAAQAARFRVVSETEVRLAAEARLAEAETLASSLAAELEAVHASRTFRYTRSLRKVYGSVLRRS